MTEAATKLAVRTGSKDVAPSSSRASFPFEALRREVDRLFEDFDDSFWKAPFRRSMLGYAPFGRTLTSTVPAVDIAEKDGNYEISAELPGIDEKDVEVKLSDGGLTIRGENKEQREEKRKGYHLSERQYGEFERFFAVPEGVDTEKVSAVFKNGVLTVSLPKTTLAQKQEKKSQSRQRNDRVYGTGFRLEPGTMVLPPKGHLT
ncbi:MAG TPA: Hsp20/alpha crystallin family protein [Rhizomicrobium sp.]|nr:Hsp20/alpha crystallin family protein [Rhizomicrobium sp.]